MVPHGGAAGRLLFTLIALLLGACALRPATAPPVALELDGTPFFPQQAWHCGPAALATLLVHAGVDTDPEKLAPQVYLPERQGSLQLELVAATRRAGKLPYLLPPDAEALDVALAEAFPVLVLQNLGSRRWPRWHYAVVIGRDVRGAWLLRSGTEFRQRMAERRFRAVWERGGRWAMVTLDPAQVPEFAEEARFVDAAAGFEAVGQFDLAATAYRATLARWPGNFAARLGLGNVDYLRGDRQSAARHYRLATELAPSHPAGWNNLATVLGEMGCRDQALAALERGEAVVTPGFVDALAETRRTLADRPVRACEL
ncbi:MAG TPA: PA2778 family cysteine peptidase [Xanthomonadaceae bacterium]|nr:PA2778 family cysteine peptidase [Xanthomonadaceae bacterium]